jgi:hypothetical protein
MFSRMAASRSFCAFRLAYRLYLNSFFAFEYISLNAFFTILGNYLILSSV